MWWRGILIVSLVLAIVAAFILVREERAVGSTSADIAARSDRPPVSALNAGGVPALATTGSLTLTQTHDAFSPYDISEGQRLYHWMNCNTCHAEGGGDAGPALMDDQWIYGGQPGDIYASIVEGRPNGMPSFGGKIPDAQIWQIVAYVRSMSGNVPFYAQPGRMDAMTAHKAPALTEAQPPHTVKDPSRP